MSAFDKLHPALQHHVVNSLGWKSLRPLQEAGFEPILNGTHVLLIAPTAGGKTEAAFLPALSRMLSGNWTGLSILYVCPLKALLNNLHARLSRYCRMVGRTCEVWHGDIRQPQRKKMLAIIPDCLLTTPESIEVMLISPSVDKKAFFGQLQLVIVDEIHAFAGDDRGWHLLSLLERLTKIAGREPQRVGLSATVGNPESLLDWLAGHCAGSRQVVQTASAQPSDADVQIDYVGDLNNAATVISRLHAGEKRLVFCDSRARVEQLTSALRKLGVETFISHSSISADERRRAEEAFSQGTDCVIVATSTLELGIDVGDLDHVIQIDAPATVAGFLQRLGRSGRREGAHRNCLFLCTTSQSLLQGTALVELWRQGYVEPIQPPASPLHIWAQQVMAILLQEHGLSLPAIEERLARLRCFSELPPEHRNATLKQMLSQAILHQDQGILWIGREGERTYGHRNFMELFSVFTSPPEVTVLWGRQEVGSVNQFSILTKQNGHALLCLAGRDWKVTHVDWPRRTAFVEPVTETGRSRWPGGPQPLTYRLCQSMKSILCSDGKYLHHSKRAEQSLAATRADYAMLQMGHTTLTLTTQPGRTKWWTFGGLLANAEIARRLRTLVSELVVYDNIAIEVDGSIHPSRFSEIQVQLRDSSATVTEDSSMRDAIDELKFSQCLPRNLAARVILDRTQDVRAVQDTLNSPLTVQQSPVRSELHRPDRKR